jgi:hypothetical protein
LFSSPILHSEEELHMKRLPDKTPASGLRRVVFEHEWRPEFVGEALTLDLDQEDRLQAIEFYSARFGVVRWTSGFGLGAARRWESEEERLDRTNDFAKHFPATFLDGTTTDVQALAIIDAVLKHFADSPLCAYVRDALAQPQVAHVLSSDWLPTIDQTVPEPELNRSSGIVRMMGQAFDDLRESYTAWSKGKSTSTIKDGKL